MLASQEHNKVRITSETLISPNDKGEDVQVSAEKNNCWFHGQGAVQKKQSKIILSPKILNLSSNSTSKNQNNILINGLKYTLTPKRSIIELKSFVVEFTRKLMLLKMFSSEEK